MDMTGEKTKGRKRYIVTDTMGNLLAVHVHAANIHDTKGGVYTFEKALYRYPTIQAGCTDGGYRGIFKNTFEEFYNIRIDITSEEKAFNSALSKRRIFIEHINRYIKRFRILSSRYRNKRRRFAFCS